MYFIGIDIDTQFTKTLILDLSEGAVVAESIRPHQNVEGLPEGHYEQDPHQWIQCVEYTLHNCLEKLSSKEKEKIQGIGVCGQQHGLVILDADDRIIRPSKLKDDTSATSQADELNQAFGGAPGLIEMLGNPARPNDCAAKLLWLKQHEPYHFERIQKALLPHDFINYWLTGIVGTEYGDASATGLLDVRTRTWSHTLLDYINPNLKEILSPISASSSIRGNLRPELAEKWNLQKNINVTAGSGNRMMKAIASGSVTPGAITIELDASAALYGVNSEALIDPRSEITALCDGNDQWLSLFQINNALSTTRTVQRHYGIPDDELEKVILSAQAGAEGVMMLPYLKKENAPKLPEASGSWHGISTSNFTAANMVRASIEGVALGLTYGFQRMQELGMNPTKARLIGEAAKSPLWRQLISDAIGIPLSASTQASEPARGAAIHAAHLTNVTEKGVSSLEELCETLSPADSTTQTIPDPRNHSLYSNLLNRQQYLVETLHGAGFL